MKITSLQIENVKRVKAARLTPSPTGLTVIGGKNGQGKTSVLDAIAWALGGAKREPSKAQRDGSMNPPTIDILLSNGIRVQRKGKSSALTVTDPAGKKAGQQLLDEFVSEFALDLPKFMNATSKEKANTLLRILGVGDQLRALDEEEQRLYSQRHAIGQIADSKTAHAAELPEYGDAPDEPVSVSELIHSQQAILARNGENQRKRENLRGIERQIEQRDAEIDRLRADLAKAETALAGLLEDARVARLSAQDLQDESTAELEAQLANIEAVNVQVAANMAKAKATEEASEYKAQYDGFTAQLAQVRFKRAALLESAALPLPGLTVENGELVYQGAAWDCMAASEQLRVATAIVRRLKPECEFVLLDKLEQMDIDTLREFDTWLKSENLQVIATRVSTGEECSIVIEDGLPVGETYADVVTGVSANTNTENTEWSFT